MWINFLNGYISFCDILLYFLQPLVNRSLGTYKRELGSNTNDCGGYSADSKRIKELIIKSVQKVERAKHSMWINELKY